jgi:unsaturated rhamnogalacturonyl hydrolase
MKAFVPIWLIVGTLGITGCGSNVSAPQDTPSSPPLNCEVESPPASRALAEESLARAIADAWIERHPADTMHWDWGPAVLSYGMLDLYEATGDAKYRRYVEAWQKHHAGKFPMIWSDTVAPASAAARLAAWSCDETLLKTIEVTRAYLETAPTTEAGGIGHLGILQEENPQLWVDSLFMFGSFLMARGSLYDTAAADWDLYAEQILIFAEELQDPSGLFRHALVHEKPFPASAVFWGRGNGWVASILSRFLLILPEEHPRYQAIADVERKLLAGVLKTQDDSGLWWTVVNHPGKGYEETSVTALFADALRRGATLGLVDKSQAADAYSKALEAVRAQVVEIDGLMTVRGTSGPTQPGGLDYYAGLPVDDDVHYGVGAVLLMLTEK